MKIEVKQLTKKYKNKLALDDISFTLEGPKIYGLLGRNGAGKTTIMDILAGLTLPSQGEILIDGQPTFDNQEVAGLVCLIKEDGNFKKDLKIKHILKSYSYFYPNWDENFAAQLLETFKLNKNMKAKTLSKGMASALGITIGLASKAPITIFDEPYIGMDAAARKLFYEILLEEYENENRMFIFSTHLIDEASLLFEEVIIIQDGKLRLKEEAEKLRDETYAVSGPKDKVETFLADKDIIRQQALAGMMTAYVRGNAIEAESSGLSTEGIPIQDLMIHLTEERQVG
ncbi:ABC transporter ATP-binding protein [Aciduricibacillus chroicocephali]|uniref:ABC transporter ATP-binding protein n=1 Tax=Aciduricibacillus chroicocephali TaxID=3054939 RepID=A0ABY9KWQ1_9BACI|nr:ABC transporter ATP-binding protein [Bacillaceae bacterium 44XB]